jgi:hypothetical protein
MGLVENPDGVDGGPDGGEADPSIPCSQTFEQDEIGPHRSELMLTQIVVGMGERQGFQMSFGYLTDEATPRRSRERAENGRIIPASQTFAPGRSIATLPGPTNS